ncbi:site-specific integrase [Pseudomonas sp. PDM31]|uniref:site-specific integrase n=1 Tax=Pseudomonas sp. PDM31 TaxID=2854778 RepID=UPI001C44B14A|nr:site-specific integrase [Pseudomonas sp. PDM31]MBV7477656.1 site-specific integrase [Pseudomonas sp. PDM31]
MKKKVILPSTFKLLEVDLNRTERAAHQLDSFYWDGDVLRHSGKTSFFMAKALSQLSPILRLSFKQHVISFTKQGYYAPNTYESFFSMLLTALNLNPTSAFDSNWIAQALTSPAFRRHKKVTTRFLLHWQERDSAAVSPDALRLLNDSVPYRNGPRNVLSDDPEKSWLTDEEYDGLLNVAWNNYDDGASSTQVTLVKLLSMQYARRPIQIAYLKVGDVRENHSDNKDFPGRIIDFPGVKDLVAETAFRDSKFETHPLSDHLWDLCCIQRQEVRALYEHVLGSALTVDQLNKLPLFCSKTCIKKARQLIETHYRLNLLEHLDSELFHLRKGYIGTIISWHSNSPNCTYGKKRLKIPKTPISPRTGKTIVVSALRMRHTRARQLARKGVPKHILSDWMGHTSEISIHAYYSDPAEAARKINEAMAPMLAPLAMAFAGTLIDSEEQAKRASDPTSKLEFAHEGELKSVGRCGKHSFCATTSVPIPCYRCMHFEPLVDAPHHEVLEALQQRMAAEEQVLKIGSPRNLLIPIDLSADIRAVKNCIARCNFHKAERRSSHE